MRKRKGLSTVTQGGEDRACRMAAENTRKTLFKYKNHAKQQHKRVVQHWPVAAAAFVPSSFTTILAFWSALDTNKGSAPEKTHLVLVLASDKYFTLLSFIYSQLATGAPSYCNNTLEINSSTEQNFPISWRETITGSTRPASPTQQHFSLWLCCSGSIWAL